MRLVRIAKNQWDVLAACDEALACQVLDFLANAASEADARKMFVLLEDRVAGHGPPSNNENMSKYLRDDIFEFKRGPKRGPKLRVLWFYGGSGRRRTVICSIALLKDTGAIPPAEIDRSIAVRDRYLKDEEDGRLEIIKIEDYE